MVEPVSPRKSARNSGHFNSGKSGGFQNEMANTGSTAAIRNLGRRESAAGHGSSYASKNNPSTKNGEHESSEAALKRQ